MHKDMPSEDITSEFIDETRQTDQKESDSNHSGKLTTILIVIAVIVAATLVYNQFSSKPENQKGRTELKTVVVEPETTSSDSTSNTELTATTQDAAKSESVTPPSSTVKVISKLDTEGSATDHSWSLNIMSLTNKAYASEHLARLTAAGFSAEITEVMIHKTKWFRIFIPGFTTADEANTTATKITRETGYKDTWVSKG